MEISLPKPQTKGKMSVEEAIFKRRSHREFRDENLSINEISQLLWSAYGKSMYYKVVPSAGAIYPFEIYINLEDGIYEYKHDKHSILKVVEGNKNKELYYASLHQEWVRDAKATIILAVNYEKIKARYGERGVRYAHFEAGHIAQNICLQAEALNLGSVCIGAFDDREVADVLNLQNLKAIYMVCIGKI